MGPKPTVDVHVPYNGAELNDGKFNAVMLGCYDSDRVPGIASRGDFVQQLNISFVDTEKGCIWRPAHLGWNKGCSDSICRYWYNPPDEFMIAVYLPSTGTTYISNEISRKNFYSSYELSISPDGTASIIETTPIWRWTWLMSFIKALIITLFFEMILAMAFTETFKLPRSLLLYVLLANLISLPIVWFVFPLIRIMWLVIPLAEIFAFVFEGWFVHHFNKKAISLKKSLLMSLLLNLVSFFIGGFVYIFLSAFI